MRGFRFLQISEFLDDNAADILLLSGNLEASKRLSVTSLSPENKMRKQKSGHMDPQDPPPPPPPVPLHHLHPLSLSPFLIFPSSSLACTLSVSLFFFFPPSLSPPERISHRLLHLLPVVLNANVAG